MGIKIRIISCVRKERILDFTARICSGAEKKGDIARLCRGSLMGFTDEVVGYLRLGESLVLVEDLNSLVIYHGYIRFQFFSYISKQIFPF